MLLTISGMQDLFSKKRKKKNCTITGELTRKHRICFLLPILDLRPCVFDQFDTLNKVVLFNAIILLRSVGFGHKILP